MRYADKTLLITGGTGSFGRAVLGRALGDFREIRIFSRDEKKQDDMRHAFPSGRIRYFIGDVRDRASVDAAMAGVDVVFAAAALKQVPSCEFFPMQALQTNALGTNNVLESALAHGVTRFVAASTDKAVYPVNAMGLSKAVMEKLVLAKGLQLGPKAAATVCCARCGNVIASRGSVVPLFLDQLRAGLPLTVTDPAMTRFVMTLDDVVDLAYYAWEHAENGDVIVPKVPAATLGTLAEAILALAREGTALRERAKRATVRVIGARHGEKPAETLVAREECVRAHDLGKYFRISADARTLDYGLCDGATKASAAVAPYDSQCLKPLGLAALKNLLGSVPLVREALGLSAGRYGDVKSVA